MNWTEAVLQRLQNDPIGGYHEGQIPATEPTALASLALFANERIDEAKLAADWLTTCQDPMNGSIGVRHGEPRPCWPTSLAVMAWKALDSVDSAKSKKYTSNQLYGAHWLFTFFGRPEKRDPNMGHDTTIVAWPWVEDTHSWIEPTAYCLLAVKSAGEGDHPRARDAVRCLIDRQLSTGGCNYGNTTVLGQELRPHVQPTGLAMLALAGEVDQEGKIATSLDYLEKSLNETTTTSSLCYGLMGLAAHGRFPAVAQEWLEASFQRTARREVSTHKYALLSLAALAERSPLITLAATKSTVKKLAI